MPSPFPGMDPYLEAHWRDIHSRLIIYASDALQSVLPSSLRARVEERVVLETPEGWGSVAFFPDLRVVKYPQTSRLAEVSPQSDVALAEPIIVEATHEPITEGYIEVVDRGSGNQIVTVIEFLSPTKKLPGAGRDQYLRKQKEICQSQTNLVEIDLNRTGNHTLAVHLDNINPRYQTSYMACVRRVIRPDKAEVYPLTIWHRLPIMKIPLRATDADVPLDLQMLIDQCYRNGAYEGTLNYALDPEPALVGTEAKWAREHLTKLGLRPTQKPKQGRGRKKRS